MQLSEIVGQKLAVKTLQSALAKEQIAHAYLFAGDKGVGKETTARSLANHLVCETKSACGRCAGCLRFARGNYPDFNVISSDSSIKIEQIRELKAKAQLAKDGYEIWLILDAERMTLQAANSFLKLLEEPGKMIVFILVAANLEQVLPTIRSRCQIINFPRLSAEDVYLLLKSKVDLAGQSKEAADLVVKMARGSIGKALELWDSPALSRRRNVVEKLMKIPDLSGPELLGLSYTWPEERGEALADLELMLQWYRDLWCLKAGAEQWVFNLDYKHELSQICPKYPLASLRNIMELITEMIIQAHRNVRIRFIMGYLLLQMRKGVSV